MPTGQSFPVNAGHVPLVRGHASHLITLENWLELRPVMVSHFTCVCPRRVAQVTSGGPGCGTLRLSLAYLVSLSSVGSLI
jgi:hypothetical protein